MATNRPQDDFQKQGVRIPRELHERIHEAARLSGRSYNSELIARLQYSFEGWAFPLHLRREVENLAGALNVTFGEALERAIFAGTVNEAASRVVIVREPDMTAEEAQKLTRAGRTGTTAAPAVYVVDAAPNERTGAAMARRSTAQDAEGAMRGDPDSEDLRLKLDRMAQQVDAIQRTLSEVWPSSAERGTNLRQIRATRGATTESKSAADQAEQDALDSSAAGHGGEGRGRAQSSTAGDIGAIDPLSPNATEGQRRPSQRLRKSQKDEGLRPAKSRQFSIPSVRTPAGNIIPELHVEVRDDGVQIRCEYVEHIALARWLEANKIAELQWTGGGLFVSKAQADKVLKLLNGLRQQSHGKKRDV